MVRLSPETSVHELIEAWPFLVDFLADYNPRFGLLKNPVMRATAGRVATLRKAAEMGGVEVDALLSAIQEELDRVAGEAHSTGEAPSAGGPPVSARAEAPPPDRAEKTARLKALVLDLHNGADPGSARDRFNELIRDVSPQEIGAMEEQLIREGLPVKEIQRLCDLHVALVQDSLDRQEDASAPPGHPVHTYMAENEDITRVAERLAALCRDVPSGNGDPSGWSSGFGRVLDEISGVHNHYLRKENELFPVLERHGITGPSQVMWGVHDEIRAMVKGAKASLEAGSASEAAAAGTSLARAVVEMVYKENKILFPLALQTLTHREWAEVRKGEDELGYAFRSPATPFPKGPSAGIQLPIVSAVPAATLPEPADRAFVDLGTGRLSLEQVDMILRHLPIEISFVDADGFVRYYSETEERLFPRTPGAIGRHVEACHPPKSVHMVKDILLKFATGERDVAEFWIEFQDKFVHIRYFAVRNAAGRYLGCLEVTQDVTGIRALQGQRRLLEWE